VLPPAVVKKATKERLDAIEQSEGARPKGNRKRQIEDEVRFELLPKAFQKTDTALAMILPERAEIWFDQSQAKKCEAVLSLMRRHAGSLPVTPSAWSEAVPLKGWAALEDDLPPGVTMGGDIKLLDVGDGATGEITIKKEELEDPDIQALIGPRAVKEMALISEEHGGFKLDAEGTIKGLKLAAEVVSAREEEEGHEAQSFLVIRTLESLMDTIARVR
jgi:recombination associated protein RdgC